MSLSVFDAAKESPSMLAVIRGEERLTYAQLAIRVEARMAELRGRGSTPVPIVALPDLETLTTLYACIELRIPIVPIHPRLPADQQAQRRAEAARFHPVGTTGEEAALALVYTSGTSGHPRVVELSHRAFLAAARANSAWLGWQPDDRWLLALSFAHVGGLSILTRCLVARRTVVIASGEVFAPAEILELIARERVTLCSFVPTQLALLLERPKPPPPELRAVLLGGAAARPALLQKAAATGWPILTTYGLTETCAQVATQRPGTRNLGDLGVGVPLPGVEVRIVEGQIQVRSDSLMTAHHPIEGSPFPVPPGGWFPTRDLGSIDAMGQLHVGGRADEVIVTGGEKVPPEEVEAVIEACAGVKTACVFGIEDPLWGQIVAVAIVPTEKGFNPRTMANELGLRLAAFQRPRRLAILEALPLTPSGKIDRRLVAATSSGRLEPLSSG
jgi:o-succinylbenzoate---CoA ligase